MTTIVYDHKNKEIAADGRATAGNMIVCDTSKKYKRHKDGSIWFFCGAAADGETLMNLKHDDKPDVLPDAAAIFIRDGQAHLATTHGEYISHCKIDYNCTIGSGREFALAAMDFGKSARDAVAYAATRDSATGGEIVTYLIGDDVFV